MSYAVQTRYRGWDPKKKWKTLEERYDTKQEALDAMIKEYRVRKVPPLPPLSKLQESVLKYLKHVGYDSAYNICRNSGYSWKPTMCSGRWTTSPLVRRGLLKETIGIKNPHIDSKRTCTIVALPWVHKYHERFDTWPSPAMIKEMEKGNGKTNK